MRLISAAAVFVFAAGLALAQTPVPPGSSTDQIASQSDIATVSPPAASDSSAPSTNSTASATSTSSTTSPASTSAGAAASPQESTPAQTDTAGPTGSGAQGAPTAAEAIAASEALFGAADLSGKLKIINEASAKPTPEMGPLYQAAVDYLVSNLSVLRTEKEGETLAIKSAQLIGQISYGPAADSVWKLFQFSTTKSVRLTALDALAIVAKGSGEVINQMNHWLAGQNLLHLSDSTVDPQLIDGCVRALAAVADPSSFQVLFSTMEAGYGNPVTNDAKNALKLVKGDLAAHLLTVVETARYSTRPAALKMAMTDSSLTPPQRGQIASAALAASLSPGSAVQVSAADLSALRFAAVGDLGRLGWTPAQPLVIENFNRTATAYSGGSATADELIISANALASMQTHEAAVRLSLYLGLINSQADKGRQFDQSVTLALISDLGRLGDKVAFDNLYAMQFLNYPEPIKAAALAAARSLSAR